MKKDAVEILAPAGSYESMVAAFNAGADAVYIGGSRFGARAYADNPGEERMLEAIRYAHLHGRKLYMTVNTLMKEEELYELYDYLKPYYEEGLDAVIVQDLGVFSFVKQYFPGLPIHASTQMTITGAEGAKLLAALGAERVVTARELSLEEIERIHRSSDVEIESFVHGALCYCYSGQCLLSSVIGGRSGNRGRCAQPCRLPYDAKQDGRILNRRDERYLMSLKDLCTLDILPDILEAGVYSLKIEGRMKSPRYTAGVVSIYRKYVDWYLKNGRKGYKVDPEDERTLLELFDRGGLTSGYYTRHSGRDMVALKEKPAFREGNAALYGYLDKTYVNAVLKEKVIGHVRLKAGEPAKLFLEMGDYKAEAAGDVPMEALNRPITVEAVEKQIKKTGNTPFEFQSLTVDAEENVFLPVQSLNQLRRAAVDALTEEILGSYRRTGEAPNLRAAERIPVSGKGDRLCLAVSLEDPEGLKAALKEPAVSHIYLDSTGFDASLWRKAADACHERGKACYLKLPQIFREEARVYFEAHMEALINAGFNGFVIGSLEEIGFLKKAGMGETMVFDHNLYGFNHMAAEMMAALGAVRQTLPLELNYKELLKTGGEGKELMVYGRIPVMVSAQCIRKTVKGCGGEELLTIRDRMGKEFPVKNHCRFCYNTIYNTSPLSLLDEAETIGQLKPSVLRLQFTTESPEEIREIIRAFAVRFLEREEAASPIKDMTRGHYKRGVE